MTDWSPQEIEKILGAKFTQLETKSGYEMHELKCELGGIIYNLTIIPNRESVWLRADTQNADGPLPHFEFQFRCDHIRTGPGGYNSIAICFEFLNGAKPKERHLSENTRLVIDSLPTGKLYIWPIIGASDPYIERPV